MNPWVPFPEVNLPEGIDAERSLKNRHDAYRLTDNESRRRYYDEWAGAYDKEHAEKTGYVYPDTVARRFLELAGPEDSPVADLGCGTGLAGLAFADSELAIDGFDVSQGMLDQARAKGVYRHLRQVDLTNGRNHAARRV